MFYIRSKVFRWANFRRAKIQTVFLKEGVKTRSWKLEAAIKRVNSIDSNCRNAYTREGRENYDPVAIQPGLQKLREKYMYTCTHVAATASWMTQNTWIILSRRLYFEMRHVSFSTIRSVRGPRNSRNLLPDLLGTGKIIIHPELWQKFLAGWEKCQCLFDPYNLSYRSLKLDRFSYISLFARKCILPKGDIDLPSPLEEIRDLEKKISFNTLVLCLLLKASSRGLLVDKFSRVIDPEVT